VKIPMTEAQSLFRPVSPRHHRKNDFLKALAVAYVSRDRWEIFGMLMSTNRSR
jgi:hypothetical protein